MKFIEKSFDELTCRELYEILKARAEVFMLGQGIICQDMDDVDYESRHLFLWENGKICAYLRAFYKSEKDVRIGRVLAINKRQGIGRELMNRALDYIKDNMPCDKISVNAQTQAVGFYEKFGFECFGDEFMEEGVPHVKMYLDAKLFKKCNYTKIKKEKL